MRKRSLGVGIVTVALAAIAPIRAGAPPTYSIDAHVISAGTSVLAASPCFRLNATIAEPVQGFSSSANYSLDLGFLSITNTLLDDGIYFDGFEGCTP